jgi:hypothetical protein
VKRRRAFGLTIQCSFRRAARLSAFSYRNRVLVPPAKKLEPVVPLTFQVLRRSHANQKRAKEGQMHLGHHSIVMNVYAQEIPESVKQMVEEDEALMLKAKPE